MAVRLAVDVRPSANDSAVRTGSSCRQRAYGLCATGQTNGRIALSLNVSPAAGHTHTHPFNGPFSGTTRVSRYQKGRTNLDFTEARDSEWQWHQLGRMQVCNSLQTDNHVSTPPLSFFCYSSRVKKLIDVDQGRACVCVCV